MTVIGTPLSAKARNVPCPTCGAAAGQGCVWLMPQRLMYLVGVVSQWRFHTTRLVHARQQLELEAK